MKYFSFLKLVIFNCHYSLSYHSNDRFNSRWQTSVARPLTPGETMNWKRRGDGPGPATRQRTRGPDPAWGAPAQAWSSTILELESFTPASFYLYLPASYFLLRFLSSCTEKSPFFFSKFCLYPKTSLFHISQNTNW